MIDRIKLIELIRTSPGIRTLQLCDQLDKDIEDVEIALQRELNAGAIEQHDVIAPNGRAAVAFTLAGVPLPAQLPAVHKNTSVKGKADNPKAAPKAVSTKLTNVDKAIAFIREQPGETATSSQLHMVLGLKPHDFPSTYIGGGINDGRLVKDGKNWTLGPKALAAGNDAPVAEKPVPVAETAPAVASAPPFFHGGPLEKPQPHIVINSHAGMTSKSDAEAIARAVQQSTRQMVTAEREQPAIPAFLRRDAQPADEPVAEGFQCALWSDGQLQLVRGLDTVVKLSASETRQVREYLSRVKLRMVAV